MALNDEQNLLGCLITETANIQTAINLGLSEAMFQHLGDIYAKIRELYLDGEHIDLAILGHKLPRRTTDIAQLSDLSYTLNAKPFIQAVMGLHFQRELIKSSLSFIEQIKSWSKDRDPLELFSMRRKHINNVSDINTPEGQGLTVWAREGVADLLTNYEEKLENKHLRNPVKTGIPALDDKLLDWDEGANIILGARTGSGKTTLALHIAINAAMLSGKKVLMFSMDQQVRKIYQKMIAARGKIPTSKIARQTLNDSELDRLHLAGTELAKLPIGICDKHEGDWNKIEEEIFRVKHTRGLDIVIIDYIQQNGFPGEKIDEREAMVLISKRLQVLRNKFKLLIFAVAQPNRTFTTEALLMLKQEKARNGSIPIKHYLKSSGNIEQDADIIMHLWQLEDAKGTEVTRDADLIIEKDKDNWEGIIPLVHHLETGIFTQRKS